MKVGFVVDHPKRDLAGGVLVTNALARRGIEVFLIPLYDQAVDVPLLGLDALIVNFARPVNLELVRGYTGMGIPVWVLDTEGGVLADNGPNTPAHLAAYVRESGFSKLLAGYFFWGSVLHDAFVQTSGMLQSTLHLTGCPRFDFAAEQWRSLLTYPRSGYVLVNANFPLANPLFGRSPQDEARALIAAGWKPDYVAKMIEDLHGVLNNFVRTVDRMAQRFPNRTFLVRPHPFENAEFYRQYFDKRENVVVDGSGTVLNVIAHCCCVLHVNCGTSIEANLLGKLPVSMEFLNTEHMSKHSSLPSNVSLRVNSEEELAGVLEDVEKATDGFQFHTRHQELIQPWFHLNDGRAGDRIAKIIEAALVAGRGLKKSRRSISASLASSRRNSRPSQRLQALLANLLGSKLSGALRACLQPKRRVKQLDMNEIRAMSNRITAHTGDSPLDVKHARHPWTHLPLATIRVRTTS